MGSAAKARAAGKAMDKISNPISLNLNPSLHTPKQALEKSQTQPTTQLQSLGSKRFTPRTFENAINPIQRLRSRAPRLLSLRTRLGRPQLGRRRAPYRGRAPLCIGRLRDGLRTGGAAAPRRGGGGRVGAEMARGEEEAVVVVGREGDRHWRRSSGACRVNGDAEPP